MENNRTGRESLNYSTFDLAGTHLRNARNLSLVALFLPLPLTGGAVWGFFSFEPTWYRDPFLCAILALFVFGQLGAFVQLISLARGSRKAARVMNIVRKSGNHPALDALQETVMSQSPSCHIRDSIVRWIQLGIQGETDGLERMMDHAATRRDQTANKIMSFHSVINRITLKFGFLGTLIGLMMTFEPMKQAMLSLQGSAGEFRFINDIVKAIDGDAYAILTTLFATGLSVFIELITIQVFDRILGHFELVNNNLDDWCLIHLQPWIKKNAGSDKGFDGVLEMQKRLAEQIIAVQGKLDEQVRGLAAYVQETARQVVNLGPLQQEVGKKVAQLVEFEKQYRQFLGTRMQGLMPPQG